MPSIGGRKYRRPARVRPLLAARCSKSLLATHNRRLLSSQTCIAAHDHTPAARRLPARRAARSGCAIHQNVRPLDAVADTQVCVDQQSGGPPQRDGRLPARADRQGLHRARAAAGRGDHRLPASRPPTAPNWRWDLAMYMHYAEFRVFVDGREKGVADLRRHARRRQPEQVHRCRQEDRRADRPAVPGRRGQPMPRAAGTATTQ